MESNKILQSDVLDILFEGKNKEYGAYQLRKTYNRRLVRAIAGTIGIVLLVFLSSWITIHRHKDKTGLLVDGTVNLAPPPAEPPQPAPPPPPPPPLKAPPPQIETKQFTPPKLVKEDVPEDEKPPIQDDLKDVKIGTVNQKGTIDDGTVAGPTAPAGDGGKGVIEEPKKKDDDGIVMVVEIESSFPGGLAAWQRFLNKNLRMPDDALNNEIQGTVIVQFIVDKEGNVSDVQAISGPEGGGLREEAIRVIKKSGKWVPAVQNGTHVKSYKRQPIKFLIGNE